MYTSYNIRQNPQNSNTVALSGGVPNLHYQETASSQDLSRVGFGFGYAIRGYMETTDVEEGEYGDGPRVKRIRQVHPQSDLSQELWSIILRKQELKRYDPREARSFRRRFRIAYELFLKLMKLAN